MTLFSIVRSTFQKKVFKKLEKSLNILENRPIEKKIEKLPNILEN